MLQRRPISSMRVAVAGTNSLALMICYYLVTETSHQLIVLSRQAQPALADQGYQIMVVDYTDQDALQHAVTGVDTVVSTVTGPAELQLLQACVTRNVRRFAPAEYEGLPGQRPEGDPLDRGKKTILEWLAYYKDTIESTVLVCGIFYERFGPGGLAAHRLGLNTALSNEGDYIINVRTMVAEAPVYDAEHNPSVRVCMIALQDAARLIVKALDLSQWPREFTMAAERMTVNEIVETVVRVRGLPLASATWHDPSTLQYELQLAQSYNDLRRQMRAYDHLATQQGRYDFTAPGNLRSMSATEDVTAMSFEAWLGSVWADQGATTHG